MLCTPRLGYHVESCTWVFARLKYNQMASRNTRLLSPHFSYIQRRVHYRASPQTRNSPLFLYFHTHEMLSDQIYDHEHLRSDSKHSASEVKKQAMNTLI